MKNINNNSCRLSGLTGLRGLAIIFIMAYHLFPYMFKGGWLGVCIFFTLSGFLIYYTTSKMFFRGNVSSFHGFAASFYMRRIRRLYPSLIIVTIVSCLIFGIADSYSLHDKPREIMAVLTGTDNFYQISRSASYFSRMSDASFLTHLWAESVEMQFYLIWPALLLFVLMISAKYSKKKAAVLMIIFAAASSIFMVLRFREGVDVTPVYYGTIERSSSLFAGVAAGILYTDRIRSNIYKKLSKITISNICFTILVFMGIMLVITDGQSSFAYRGGISTFTVLTTIIIYFSASAGIFRTFFDNPAFLWLGSRSYELYLIHYPVMRFVRYMKWKENIVSIILQFAVIFISAEILYIFTYRRKNKTITTYLAERNQKMRIKKTIPVLVTGIIVCLTIILVRTAVIFNEENFSDVYAQVKSTASERDIISTDSSPEKKQTNNTDRTFRKKTENIKEDRNISTGRKDKISSSDITFIGDSVMLGAKPALEKIFKGCVVDAKESRQVRQCVDIVNALKADGKLKDTVVIALGTNGPFSTDTGDALLDAIGSDKKIYWVTVYGKHLDWQDNSNESIENMSSSHKNVSLIRWDKEAPDHPDWIYNDGIHLRPAGQKGYAKFIKTAINE